MTGTALDQIVCWVVSDGRRGIENQALGLAEAVARRLADQSIQARIERVVVRQDGFVTLPSGACPDIWIGCGRAAVQIVSKHRRIFPETYFVYIQDPRRRHDLFDLIIAPDHDRLKRHNAIGMIGSPNRVAQSQLTEAAREFKDRIEALPGPRAAILIGGDSKRFKLDASVALYLEERLQSLLDQNVSLMITVSRRTPVAVRKTLHDRFAGQDRVWFHDGESDPDAANPYFAFLAAADWVFVTEESTNMLVEAATLGKPVYVLAMSGRPGKFARLHAALEGSGAARPYLGHLDTWRYDPLDETGRVADILIQRWQAERAAHENGDIMSREDLQVGRDSIVARHGRICFASQPGQADLECWAAQGVDAGHQFARAGRNPGARLRSGRGR